MRDLRFAVRTLIRQPAFSLAAALTLAVGIGANTAIFSVLYQVFLRPLPYPDSDRLVYVWNTYPRMGLPKASVSIPDYLDRLTQAPSIEAATLFTAGSLSLAAEGEPAQLRTLSVTPSFFTTLQRSPMLGRAFLESDATPDADNFVILGHGLWTTRFGGDPSIVGRDVRLGGESYSVVGVLSSDFTLPMRDVALLVPFAFTAQQKSDAGRGNEFSQMIARLRPAATIADANADMREIVRRNLERLPDRRAFAETSGFGGYAVPIRDELAGDSSRPLLVLQAGVALLLVIACVNVANLLLMRATARGRELAIRTALGAGRGHLLRQTLIEGLVLSTAGGLAGLGLGVAGVRLIVSSASAQLPSHVEPAVLPAVLAFTLALTVATGVFFGMVPAFAALAGNVGAMLKDDATRNSGGRSVSAARAMLVVAETALALMLLVGTGLLVKSFARLLDVNPGFTPHGVLTAQISLPQARYPDATARTAFWDRLVEKAAGLPGVSSVGLTSNIPFNGSVASGSYSIVGYTPPAGEALPHGRQEVVGADYFRSMQIPLVSGRLFNDADAPGGQRVVVVDQYLVNRYFPGRDPLGQQIRRGGPTSQPFTIVGVVGTINSIDLGQPVAKERLYYPLRQTPLASMGLVLKTGRDPVSLVPELRAALASIDSEQPLADVRTMGQWVSRSLESRRTPTMLLALFGLVALVLAAMGIYGVLAYGVAQRERELGIRQALGADQPAILTLVLVEGMRTAGLGLAIGLGLSAFLTRYLGTLLFGVGPLDASVFVVVTLVLLAVAAIACYVPARRATSVDPVVALRV
jgi:predicted permease